MKLSSLLIPLFIISGTAAAQTHPVDIRFRLAQSYERSGDFEAAIKIFEQLFSKDSTNLMLVDALHRDYVQMKRYDDAINLLSRGLKASPNDPLLLSQLGALYNLKSDEPTALRMWNLAIAVDSSHEGTYRTVASSMIESRLFDKAIMIYQRGRIACRNPNLFTNDIAYLNSITLNYEGATKEYLGLLRQARGQLGYVQSRIAPYIVRGNGLTAATSVVEQAVKAEPDSQPFQQLLAWLYLEAKQYDRAYEVYKVLDAKEKAGGREIFNFAERALKEKGYASAADAYQLIMTKFQKFEMLPQTKFGYARTLEEWTTQRDTSNPFFALATSRMLTAPETESAPMYTGAVAAYDNVINEYPKTDFAARALFRIAVLKQERFFDLDGARLALTSIEKNYPGSPIFLDARVRLGDVYLMMGNLTQAANVYRSLTDRQVIVGEQRERAALRLAELDYYQGKFQDALTKLQQLTRNVGSDITNDALTLQIFIQDNMTTGDAALRDFAKSELLERQHKISEAVALFQSITKTYPTSSLVDESIAHIGDLLLRLKRYADAIASFEHLLKDFPESIVLDAALMKIGYTYEIGMKDKVKAIETYQKLLEELPNSIYVNEARKRIRGLRGETI